MNFNRSNAALRWASAMFGAVALNRHERALRFIEEALELVQSLGISHATIKAVTDRVYTRRAGTIVREIGQCRMTFDLLAHVIQIDPDAEADKEFARVQAIPKEEWDRRHAAKQAIGIALPK